MRASLAGVLVLGVCSLAACASRPLAGAPPRELQPRAQPVEVHQGDGFAVLIPGGWRRMSFVETGSVRLYLSGDGIATAAADHTGEPVQVGMVVERRAKTSATAHQLVEQDLATLTRDARMADLEPGAVSEFQLADGTQAVMQAVEFIRVDKASRRSHYLKLYAIDRQGMPWHAAAWIVTGPEAAPSRALVEILSAHLRSLTFDPTRLSRDEVTAAYGSQ